jgi:hypothetical protein
MTVVTEVRVPCGHPEGEVHWDLRTPGLMCQAPDCGAIYAPGEPPLVRIGTYVGEDRPRMDWFKHQGLWHALPRGTRAP